MKWNFRESEAPPKRIWVLLYINTGITKSPFMVGKYFPAKNHSGHGTFDPQSWKLTNGRKIDFQQVKKWAYIDKPIEFD